METPTADHISDAVAVDRLLADLTASSHRVRCRTLRDICPCRNGKVQHVTVWRAVFHKARHGGIKERRQAAHAIGTLSDKATRNADWHALLRALRPELDALMADSRASQALLGTMKRHGHMHRGAARQNYRRHRQRLELATPDELAAWLNQELGLASESAVDPQEPGIERLWRWLKHRIACQPTRATKDAELLQRARRYLPQAFAHRSAAVQP